MIDGFTHIRESSDDTQRHLDENRSTFETHCQILLKMMVAGKRLTTQMVTDMHISDRRLRNLHNEGKCKREWVYKELPNGKKKRTHVEYFCEIPKPMTKGKLVALYQPEFDFNNK